MIHEIVVEDLFFRRIPLQRVREVTHGARKRGRRVEVVAATDQRDLLGSLMCAVQHDLYSMHVRVHGIVMHQSWS